MRRYPTLAAATVAMGVIAAAPAQAKISCGGVHRPAEIRVTGIPAQPVAGVEYDARVTVPRSSSPANPSPLVMFVRCPYAPAAGFTTDLPGVGAVEIPLRFSEAGRWRATLMDRGGRFHSLGTFDVRRFDSPGVFEAGPQGTPAASAAASSSGGGGGSGLPIAAAALVAGAGALLVTRRRRSS